MTTKKAPSQGTNTVEPSQEQEQQPSAAPKVPVTVELLAAILHELKMLNAKADALAQLHITAEEIVQLLYDHPFANQAQPEIQEQEDGDEDGDTATPWPSDDDDDDDESEFDELDEEETERPLLRSAARPAASLTQSYTQASVEMAPGPGPKPHILGIIHHEHYRKRNGVRA